MPSFFPRKAMLLFLLFPFTSPAQSSPPKTQNETAQNVVKSNTRQVVVDVVVTDSKGAPIVGLEAQDFTVMESGKPQKVTDFTFQHPQEIAGTALTLQPNTFTNVPVRKSSSLNVILLDGLNGEFASRAQALDQLVKFLESAPSIQPTAVYVLEQKLRLMHDFTTDTKVLKQVLAGYRPHVAQHVDTAEAAASAFIQQGTFQTSPQTIESTLRALDALAQSLAGYPGRKNLIWVSEAFPVDLFPDLQNTSPNESMKLQPGATQAANDQLPDSMTLINAHGATSYSDYMAEAARVADAFMSTQVAVYPVDAAGVARLSRVDARGVMRTMAERTGGKTYANQNDLKDSIRNSMDDGATYYTLAYYPDDKHWDGRFRQIEVKLDHPGANLRYRQGYYALNPDLESKTESKKLAAEFTQALALDSPSSTAVLFHATATPMAGSQKVIVNFAIDPHTLAYTQKEDGSQQANLGCAIVAYTTKGSIVRNELNNVVGTVKAAQFAQLMQSNFPCQCTIELKPGQYMLRLGVLDKKSMQMGTTTAAITVP